MDREPKILVVDDETNLLRSMEKTLLRAGYDVETAESNTPALRLFENALDDDKPFDLVVVDLNMLGFDGVENKYAGLELMAAIHKESPGIPVIVNSAWDEVETVKICIDRGAADYFVKGRSDEMLQKIRTVLGST